MFVSGAIISVLRIQKKTFFYILMHVICCYYPFRALHWWRGLLLVFRFRELLAIFREPDSSQLPNNRTQSNLKFSHLHFGLSMWILAFMSSLKRSCPKDQLPLDRHTEYLWPREGVSIRTVQERVLDFSKRWRERFWGGWGRKSVDFEIGPRSESWLSLIGYMTSDELFPMSKPLIPHP